MSEVFALLLDGISSPWVAFGLSLCIILVLTPVIRRFALGIGALVKPGGRSIHTSAVPHLGGVGMCLAFVVVMLMTGLGVLQETRGALLGSVLICALGVYDDFKPLNPKVKLLGQILIAAIPVLFFDVRITFLSNPFGKYIILGSLSVPITVFWIVACVNVVNLIDGLDGLAAGVTAISSLTLLVVSLQAGQAPIVLTTATLAGCTVGFLPYNFNPAKIFMGDAGAMFLGYTLALVAVEGSMKSATTIALIIPLLALGVPIFDTSFAILRRAVNGQPIYQADRGHLHHRLIDLGLTQRQAVAVIYGMSAYLGLLAISLDTLGPGIWIVLTIPVLAGVFIVGRRTGVLELKESKDEDSKTTGTAGTTGTIATRTLQSNSSHSKGL
jgi:UDP-GlcNAc:undecaprenyl-phosphate GlcNAc-1-phosphate transferase